jgi:hypothetical protein
MLLVLHSTSCAARALYPFIMSIFGYEPMYAYSEAFQGLIFINCRPEASQIVKGRTMDLQESRG